MIGTSHRWQFKICRTCSIDSYIIHIYIHQLFPLFTFSVRVFFPLLSFHCYLLHSAIESISTSHSKVQNHVLPALQCFVLFCFSFNLLFSNCFDCFYVMCVCVFFLYSADFYCFWWLLFEIYRIQSNFFCTNIFALHTLRSGFNLHGFANALNKHTKKISWLRVFLINWIQPKYRISALE